MFLAKGMTFWAMPEKVIETTCMAEVEERW
jgi:hypothetical protein